MLGVSTGQLLVILGACSIMMSHCGVLQLGAEVVAGARGRGRRWSSRLSPPLLELAEAAVVAVDVGERSRRSSRPRLSLLPSTRKRGAAAACGRGRRWSWWRPPLSSPSTRKRGAARAHGRGHRWSWSRPLLSPSTRKRGAAGARGRGCRGRRRWSLEPSDMIKIARVAGRMSGRAVGHLMLFRRQMDDILEQTAARKVNKELKDAMTQLDSIRYEVQNLSRLTPAQLVMKQHSTAGMAEPGTDDAINGSTTKQEDSRHEIRSMIRDEIENYCRRNPDLFSRKLDSPDPIQKSGNPHSKASIDARLTEAPGISGGCGEQFEESNEQSNVLPISAESAGLLPKRPDEPKGSDLVLEAVIEADVAELAMKAKHKLVTNPHDQLPE